MKSPAVAVIGASNHRHKFGNKAVRAYRSKGYTVYPVNPHEENVEGLPCYPTIRDVPQGPLERILLYVPPETGIGLLEDIKWRHAQEVWLNPGADSPALLERARALELDVIRACSIIDIGRMPD